MADEHGSAGGDPARRETRALNINIRADLHARMGHYRADHGATLTDQVEEAVEQWLEARKY